MTDLPITRKDADDIFLDLTLRIAKEKDSLYLKARAYLFYAIARLLGGFRGSGDSYTGCGISKYWATSEKDPFYGACQVHDAFYEKIKGA